MSGKSFGMKVRKKLAILFVIVFYNFFLKSFITFFQIILSYVILDLKKKEKTKLNHIFTLCPELHIESRANSKRKVFVSSAIREVNKKLSNSLKTFQSL